MKLVTNSNKIKHGGTKQNGWYDFGVGCIGISENVINSPLIRLNWVKNNLFDLMYFLRGWIYRSRTIRYVLCELDMLLPKIFIDKNVET